MGFRGCNDRSFYSFIALLHDFAAEEALRCTVLIVLTI